MLTFRTLVAGAFALVQLAFGVAAQSTLPPAPPQKIAVNALTNKVYTANYEADTVTAFNAATGTSTPIAVGDGPLYLAVNPVTNRVYVNNARAASISVIDGATDTLIATYPVGSTGPIAVNPVTNVLYIVRLTGTGTDEVTYFNGANNTWYTIAVQSHQPIAVAVNPVTNKLFVAAYATGNVSIIDGTFNSNNDHPTPIKMGMWSKPFALAVNPVTNKVFVITEDSRGPIAVLDVNTLTTTFLLAGTARVPKAVAVNPVTNKAYALFSNELVVIDGATLATTSVPVADAGTAVATLGVNTATNRILVASATGVLTVVDGSTHAVITTGAVPAGTSGVAINAATGTTYFFDTALHAVPRAVGEATAANPVVTTITPLAGDTAGPDATLTLNATTSFAPGALPIRAVYYQLDSTTGPWIAASGSGPYTAAFTGLAPGSHTLHAFAVEGQDAPFATGAHSAPLVGTMASYAFTVASGTVDPSVSLASSSNPSTAGDSVTFTASVSGSNGTATGTVTFRDGASALCSSVALAAGAATCSSAALSVGTHDITAEYSGDANYNPRVSGILQQQVSAVPRALTVSKAGAGGGTVSSSPAGIACGPTCSASFADGTSVALTATADGGSVFSGWGGACTGTGACNVTMDAAKSVTATFTLVPPPRVDPTVTLTSSSNPSTAGSLVTFTASVSGSRGLAAGTVTFRDGTTALCSSVALASGAATCSSAALAIGTHDITAQYSGDANYNPRISGLLQQQVSPATTVPGAPTNVTATPGNGQATIAFSPPSSNGGAAITSYTVSCTPGAATASAAASPIVMTGLANGTSYACSVVATNAVGSGPASAPVNVTPQAGTQVLTVVRGGSGSGTVTSSPPGIACGSACSASFAAGASVALTATAGAGSVFSGWSGACSGNGACNVTMDVARTVTATFDHDTNPPRLGNISTRAQVLTGDDVMIGGFVIGGSTTKRVAIVATGPSLAAFGIANPLANPTLRLVRSSDQATIAINDDWQTAANQADLTAAGFAPSNSLEAAILVDLAPGAYTAIVEGAGGGTGVSVIGVYEVDHPETPLINIATRGKVLTGDDVMIGGFVINGTQSRTVAIVATGPSLSAFGIASPLANPKITLVRSSDQAVIDGNDDWQAHANAPQLSAAGFEPTHAQEAAILVTLPPGAYTAIVEGVGGGTGVAVIGVYKVGP